jgi:hypothetical protein
METTSNTQFLTDEIKFTHICYLNQLEGWKVLCKSMNSCQRYRLIMDFRMLILQLSWTPNLGMCIYMCNYRKFGWTSNDHIIFNHVYIQTMKWFRKYSQIYKVCGIGLWLGVKENPFANVIVQMRPLNYFEEFKSLINWHSNVDSCSSSSEPPRLVSRWKTLWTLKLLKSMPCIVFKSFLGIIT